MAVGKQVGEFSVKITSVTHGVQNTQLNTDGTASGFGRVQGTITVHQPAAPSGTCSGIVAAYLDDGSIIGSTTQGTWESIGKHKWRLRQVVYTSDGRSFVSDGELEFATDSFTGQLYEWS